MTEYRKVTAQGRVAIPVDMLEQMSIAIGGTVKVTMVLNGEGNNVIEIRAAT